MSFYDDGNTPINTSTWEQCGQAITALLSLKELPEDENDESPCVTSWRNKPLYIASFKVSQRDIFDSVNRVTGRTDKDWTIEYQPTAERYVEGMRDLQKGDMSGFSKALYARLFYPNGDGDYESKRGLANKVLGLPKEDLDECTQVAVQMVENGWSPW